ncbi:MAG TPA: RsmG family class I SAM-dependent methyltransferase [Candidatus Deferrimicrobium sp.]|nr:RsmG family class I SAM-dependent methyltransferase [Candidatus Deferrimicrobium sp.]
MNEINARAIKEYVDILWESNAKMNLVSRQMSTEELNQLLDETFLLNEYITSNIIIDAGSGNGLLGIPIALINKDRKIILVEPKQKKIGFLNEVKNRLNLSNVEIMGVSLEEYMKKAGRSACSLIARGFPELLPLIYYVKTGVVREAIIVTSENKIKKNEKHLVSVNKKIYNVPLRTHLKILKMEKKNRP